MATDFPVTQDQIIQAAMRECGALDPTAIPTPQDYANIGLTLNMLLKTWVADGIPLWKVVTLPVPMVANQAAYSIGTLGPDVITDRVLRVLEAEIQYLNTGSGGGQSITLFSLAREQYVELSGKFISFGVPTHYWFQPLGSEMTEQSSLLTMYPIPSLSDTWQVLLKALQPIANTIQLTDVLDFPSEYYLPLKWCLAYEIANSYPVTDSRYARIEKRAMAAKEEITEWGQEQDVEVRIKYDRRGR
jgi:hypothetical protein